MSGKPFSRGALYCLLSNPIYVGEIRHKQLSHRSIAIIGAGIK
jgi:hypothetical protein